MLKPVKIKFKGSARWSKTRVTAGSPVLTRLVLNILDYKLIGSYPLEKINDHEVQNCPTNCPCQLLYCGAHF